MQFNKFKIIYFLMIILVVFLGLFFRKFEIIPQYVGDFLYGSMVYTGFRFLFTYKPKSISFIAALICCFTIEFLQLCNANWLENLRQTQFGIYVLGSGFLLSDLLAYTLGILLFYLIDRKINNG